LKWEDYNNAGEWEEFYDELEYEDSPEESVEILMPDWMPEDHWDEILEIKNPKVRLDQVEKEERLHEEREELMREYDEGEIEDWEFEALNRDLMHRESGLNTRRAIRTQGIDYPDLGELSEEYDILTTGDIERIEMNDRLNAFVKADPESAQERADRMFENGEIGEEAYELICEKVNRYKG
jgi:hypothetical protein